MGASRLVSSTSGNRSETGTSDAEGRFEVEDVSAGPIVARASSEDWAPSDELSLEVTPGEALAEVVLNLTIGGTHRVVCWTGRELGVRDVACADCCR